MFAEICNKSVWKRKKMEVANVYWKTKRTNKTWKIEIEKSSLLKCGSVDEDDQQASLFAQTVAHWSGPGSLRLDTAERRPWQRGYSAEQDWSSKLGGTAVLGFEWVLNRKKKTPLQVDSVSHSAVAAFALSVPTAHYSSEPTARSREHRPRQHLELATWTAFPRAPSDVQRRQPVHLTAAWRSTAKHRTRWESKPGASAS